MMMQHPPPPAASTGRRLQLQGLVACPLRSSRPCHMQCLPRPVQCCALLPAAAAAPAVRLHHPAPAAAGHTPQAPILLLLLLLLDPPSLQCLPPLPAQHSTAQHSHTAPTHSHSHTHTHPHTNSLSLTHTHTLSVLHACAVSAGQSGCDLRCGTAAAVTSRSTQWALAKTASSS